MSLRSLLVPTLAALAVLWAGGWGARSARNVPAIRARIAPWDQGFHSRWSPSAAGGERPALLVAGSSLSRAEGAVTLASELERVLKRPVRNASGDGHFLGDEWAELMARRLPVAERHLLELNPWLFDERRLLYNPRQEDEIVRRPENALVLFGAASLHLRTALLFQPGLHALLAGCVRRWLAPYDLGQGLREGLRDALREACLEPLDPAIYARVPEPTPAHVRALVRDNFQRKSYGDGLDALVLRDLLAWIEAQPRPSAYVLYFPPLDLALIRRLAGEEALERLTAWSRAVRTDCTARGIPLIDALALFAEREGLFLDYGHLRERAFRPLAEFVAGQL